MADQTPAPAPAPAPAATEATGAPAPASVTREQITAMLNSERAIDIVAALIRQSQAAAAGGQLSAGDAAELASYRAIGPVADVKSQIERAGQASAELTTYRRRDLVQRAAGVAGANAEALAAVAGALDLEIDEAAGAVFVKAGDGTKTALKDYATTHWAALAGAIFPDPGTGGATRAPGAAQASTASQATRATPVAGATPGASMVAGAIRQPASAGPAADSVDSYIDKLLAGSAGQDSKN